MSTELYSKEVISTVLSSRENVALGGCPGCTLCLATGRGRGRRVLDMEGRRQQEASPPEQPDVQDSTDWDYCDGRTVCLTALLPM